MTASFIDQILWGYLFGWTATHDEEGTTYRQNAHFLHVHFPVPLRGTTTDFFFQRRSVLATPLSLPAYPHWLTLFAESAAVASTIAAFLAHGYRFIDQQPVLSKTLVEIPPVQPANSTMKVTTELCMGVMLAAGPAAMDYVPCPLAQSQEMTSLLHLQGHMVSRGTSYETPQRYAYLDAVATAPEYRQQGFATALLQHVEANAHQAGMTHSLLATTPMGQPLYAKLGYEQVATVIVLEKIPTPQQAL
ncbi:MAG: GNAT family N-acetyltransferase [Ktedonobacterales bacterium]|nr:GNAT family N-acetyltransferase [Ktedonobacterales bacterium]